MTLMPCACERLDALAVVADRPLALQPQHAGLARSVDVGVEQPDPGAIQRQGQRQVDRGGRLADAALAGRHGHDVADAGQRRQLALGRVRSDLPADGDRGRRQGGLGPQQRLEFGLERAGIGPRGKAEFDLDDRPAAVQSNGLHSFGSRQRHPQVRFDIIPDQEAGLGE